MKLLVALDGTEKDQPIVRKAAELAKAARADVVLLSVVNPWVDASTVNAPTMEAAVQQVLAARRSYMDEKAREFGEVPTRVLVEQVRRGGEDVDGCITRVAREEGTDIIVVGGKGAGGVAGFFLGSVVQNLLGSSPSALLIVPPW